MVKKNIAKCWKNWGEMDIEDVISPTSPPQPYHPPSVVYVGAIIDNETWIILLKGLVIIPVHTVHHCKVSQHMV